MCSSITIIYEIVIYSLTVRTIMKYGVIATVYVTYYIVTETFLSFFPFLFLRAQCAGKNRVDNL